MRARESLPLAAGVAGGSLLLWSLLRRQGATGAPVAGSAPAPARRRPPGTDWRWPLPFWGQYSPIVSDGWGSSRTTLAGTPRLHRGVDLMYARRSATDHVETYPPGTAAGSDWHFMPSDIPALAAAPGRVVYADRTPRGHAVRLEHAARWSTFYQHLTDLRVGRGDVVAAGAVLGYVGGDPTKRPPLRHLHFEVRRPDGTPIDPGPLLRTWPRPQYVVAADGAIATTLHPAPRHA